MDIFDLSPEELTALTAVLSIGIAKQYTEGDQLGVLALFFTSIGDILALIQLQRLSIAARVEKVQNEQSAQNTQNDKSTQNTQKPNLNETKA
ncbi:MULTISPECIES: hypothetical protein [Clostridium]|jgi:hypothetical protein|uniref:Uncharacterized protein n=3 Tax=Clostridium beijerinckii TaxID=1520 RepID=A0A1S8NTH1_CLOBE|nr:MULTISPECIES: hypothetical protein [Clostridium]ABR34451.1 hypothetical protein Cbei_2291 [Clostridium beijerinckii NCIMB 8052]AIU04970.1 hypothetical protein Cbs_2291 [Clostridium beijerinckii ATCC 35702]AVK51257.1 hypothetical protein AXY43_26395 [Clostridium sp. MF28]MBC2460274.1 hypothetical protein [Clostridium beijerinckii]MBC2477773.1 hypothetical protein [Clostridium beijerinckii]